MGRSIRFRSVGNVIAELEFLKKNYETCHFSLLDDTLRGCDVI